MATSELQSLSLFFVLITEEGSNHYAIIGSSYCPCKMLNTFFTDYIRLGLSVQCLSSAILQQWTIGRQSQAMACLQPRSSCSLFKVDKEMNDASLQRCWLCVTPRWAEEIFLCQVRAETWCSHIGRQWLLFNRTPWLLLCSSSINQRHINVGQINHVPV